uniref:Uncharacterized protein n=1 Tax=Plukenetia volubilis TaxID=316893 RepID=A0A291LRG6_9ROSI|nr:hypothetical protein [Plukenetia volubilis]
MWFRRIQLQENQERRDPPPPFRPLFGLKNAGFKNERLPFSDPYCPTRERTANAFHLLNRVLWSVRDPWMPKASLG